MSRSHPHVIPPAPAQQLAVPLKPSTGIRLGQPLHHDLTRKQAPTGDNGDWNSAATNTTGMALAAPARLPRGAPRCL